MTPCCSTNMKEFGDCVWCGSSCDGGGGGSLYIAVEHLWEFVCVHSHWSSYVWAQTKRPRPCPETMEGCRCQKARVLLFRTMYPSYSSLSRHIVHKVTMGLQSSVFIWLLSKTHYSKSTWFNVPCFLERQPGHCSDIPAGSYLFHHKMNGLKSIWAGWEHL